MAASRKRAVLVVVPISRRRAVVVVVPIFELKTLNLFVYFTFEVPNLFVDLTVFVMLIFQ